MGGDESVEADGTLSINNPKAAAALDMAKSWIGTISPEGVLAQMEEDTRGIWQAENAAFARGWTCIYALSNASDSPVAGKFDIAPLPAGPDPSARQLYTAAIAFALFLGSAEFQKAHALALAEMPTLVSRYSDPDLPAQQPVLPKLLEGLDCRPQYLVWRWDQRREVGNSRR